MHWKHVINFIVTLIFSFFYFLVALVNFIGPFHPPIATIQGPRVHPFLSIAYFFLALIISWSLYFGTRHRSARYSFFTIIIVGIAMIIAGLFLWSMAIRFEDTVVSWLPWSQPATA